MFITDGVNLPEKVVEAHAKGRLVFFVGAGASMDAPSNLPSFKALARQLADAARVPFDEDEDIAIDLFLGSMPATFDAHAQAHRIILHPDSAPNPTHAAIARVASATGSARVVTTNFDDHLSSAAGAESVPFDDRWIGPALPMGDDFTGVVHLHGSVARAPRELVLTDRDFGRAYMTDAWATRFLQKMFEKFTVVFIGYSLDDPIMRYLSLGLPSKTRRYVLTNKLNDPKWEHLGIRPIEYPGTETDHSSLLAALVAWDLRARMGQLQHRERMREIIEGGTALTPVDRDYVIRRLRTIEGARDFAATADTVAWLRWAEDRPRFRALFSGAPVKEPTLVLAEWFANYVADLATHGAALQTVQRLGQKLHPAVVASASFAAERLATADETAGKRWKTLLATSIYGHSASPDVGILLPYESTGPAAPLAVVRAALRPFLVLKKDWFLQDEDNETPPGADVTWHTDEHTLGAHVQRAIADADEGDPVLGALLEDALNSAYDLLGGYRGDRNFDSLGFRRSAIEPHGQDAYRDPQDAVIDALRDFGEKGLSVVSGLPERWWSRGRSLFRRLALHLVAFDESKTSDEKIRWALDRDALYSGEEKHETFRLLAQALPEASAPVRAELLASALRGPDYPEDMSERERHIAYATYNLLAWLTNSAPDWVEGAAAFADAQAANPSFGVRENPDFDHWSSSGTWGGHLPIDPEDFIRDADSNLEVAFNDLLDRDYSERNIEEPDWDDALSVVRRVAEIRPSMGVDLWWIIEGRDDLGERTPQLRRAIVGGWEKGDLGAEPEAVFDLVRLEIPAADSARSISQFLLSKIRSEVDADESSTTANMRQIAKDLWAAHGDSFVHGPDSQSSYLALNSWPGELATYWAVEVDRRWRHDRENWTGLNDDEREAMVSLLRGPAPTLDATRPAFASVLYFLFAADHRFVEENLLPLFSDENAAGHVWGTYLYSPRVDDKLLAAGFLDAIIFEWDRLENLGDRGLQRQFFALSAYVAIYAGISASDRQRLLDKSVLADDGQNTAKLAAAVVDLLDSPNADGAEVWDLWLRDHLAARLANLPRIAEPEELARWADTVPFLGDRIPDAVQLLHGSGVGLGEHFRSPDIPDGALTAHGPELIALFAERIRNSQPSGWALPHAVRELIKDVRSVLGDAVEPIEEAARERGFIQ